MIIEEGGRWTQLPNEPPKSKQMIFKITDRKTVRQVFLCSVSYNSQSNHVIYSL